MTAAVASTGHDYGVASGAGVPDVKGGLGRSESQDFGQLVLACNKDGMDYLRKGQYKQAFEQLKYAEAVLIAKEGEDEPTNLFAVTCNNLGCYYKKVGKLHAALSYLRKALKIEVSLQTDDVTVAGTHLNICAILSKLDKHDKAVQHALCALDLISNRVSAATDAVTQDEYSVLAIAYHNVAVERDYLHQWDQAAAAYQQGHQIAKKCLGEQHALTQTLGKNCDAAMQKSQKFGAQTRDANRPLGKAQPPTNAPRPRAFQPRADESAYPEDSHSNSGMLPELPGTGGRGKDVQSMPEEALPIPTGRSVHQETEDWMQTEEAAGTQWRGSASAAPVQPPSPSLQTQQPLSQPYVMSPRSVPPMQTGSASSTAPAMPFPSYEHGGALPSEPPLGAGMESADMWAQQPSFLDSIAKDVRAIQASAPSSPQPLVMTNREKRQMDQASPRGGYILDDMSQSIAPPAGPRPPGRPPRPAPRPPPPAADSKDAVSNAPGRPARSEQAVESGTYAPAKSTRAQRQAAREAAKHKAADPDEIKQSSLRAPQSQMLRQTAVVRVQKAWRAHWKHKTQSKSRKQREREAATSIQARWRAFHVRRSKMNKMSTVIQRHVRGYIVRIAMKRHKAAVAIQKHTQGLLVRKQHRAEEQMALKIQKAARGRAARQFAQQHKDDVDNASAVLQRGARMWQAKKAANEKRQEKAEQQAMNRAAKSIQSVFRGDKDRKKVNIVKEDKFKEELMHRSAIKIQAHARKVLATKRVDSLRQARLKTMSRAATLIRKNWLRAIYRKRFLDLRQEFLTHEKSIITMQRYVRGFLVRQRMWKDAIRAEEELWATVEIQRCWRGYQGRLRWELAYESIWSREAAAHRIQRYVRGWLGRTRVHRMRKRLARAEFQKARRRFKAAQNIQACMRGVLTRKHIMGFKKRKLEAATKIQKVFRGHRLRCMLWEKVISRRIVQIQAVGRGFITRNRKFKLVAKVIMMQRVYRHWLHFIPEAERQRRLKTRRRRQPAVE